MDDQNDPRESPRKRMRYHWLTPYIARHRRLTRPRFETDVVTLVVGEKEEKLLLHKSHIEKSRFLTAAFKEEWARGARELKLPEDDAEVLGDYLHYLYVSLHTAMLTDLDC